MLKIKEIMELAKKSDYINYYTIIDNGASVQLGFMVGNEITLSFTQFDKEFNNYLITMLDFFKTRLLDTINKDYIINNILEYSDYIKEYNGIKDGKRKC